jgi:hypothetical protein
MSNHCGERRVVFMTPLDLAHLNLAGDIEPPFPKIRIEFRNQFLWI